MAKFKETETDTGYGYLVEITPDELHLIEEALILTCGRFNAEWLKKGVVYEDITDEWDVARNKLHDEFYKVVTYGVEGDCDE